MIHNITTRKWYHNKRYIVPLIVFGLFLIIEVANDPDNNTVQQKVQIQNQVKSDTITIPAYQQPIKVIQEQPKTDAQQNIQSPEDKPSTPNYYINSKGNTVQSPTKSQNGSIPAGASARCRDSTYSFSQSRRGTCSHHGGVAEWY